MVTDTYLVRILLLKASYDFRPLHRLHTPSTCQRTDNHPHDKKHRPNSGEVVACWLPEEKRHSFLELATCDLDNHTTQPEGFSSAAESVKSCNELFLPTHVLVSTTRGELSKGIQNRRQNVEDCPWPPEIIISENGQNWNSVSLLLEPEQQHSNSLLLWNCFTYRVSWFAWACQMPCMISQSERAAISDECCS